jgi:2-aminobenzoylacetyl-CoA thioesterase
MKNHTFSFIDSYDHIKMLGNGHIPAFLSDCDPPLLFDPGVSAFGPMYLNKLHELLNKRAEKTIVLLTHSHFDHCGAAPYLIRKIPGIKIGAAPKAAEVLQKQSAIDLIRRFNSEYEKKMADDLKNEDTTFSGINVDFQLREGDRIELNNNKYCLVLETPGHTRDCLSYYFPDSGILVSGEAAGVPEDDFIHSVFLSDYACYTESIKKLRSVKASVLCIAHVGILVGKNEISKYLSAALQSASDYREMIEDKLSEYDGDIEKLIDKITAYEYDSKTCHIVNRNPFIANLRAKANAVLRFSHQSKAMLYSTTRGNHD